MVVVGVGCFSWTGIGQEGRACAAFMSVRGVKEDVVLMLFLCESRYFYSENTRDKLARSSRLCQVAHPWHPIMLISLLACCVDRTPEQTGNADITRKLLLTLSRANVRHTFITKHTIGTFKQTRIIDIS